MEKYKYVWLNLNTGEFSNSWDEKTQQCLGDTINNELKDESYKGCKMIKYECLNDTDFEFYNKMKLR